MSSVSPTNSNQDIPSNEPPGGGNRRKRNLSIQTANVTDSGSSSLENRVGPLPPGQAEVAICCAHSQRESTHFVQTIHEGLGAGTMRFEVAARGNSAPYFIKEGDQTVAIFKAAEREIVSRDGIQVQQGVFGELIGYQLGYEDAVPLTVLVNLSINTEGLNLVHRGPPKFGSLQQWNQNAESLLAIPQQEHYNNAVQRLAILDLRILNTDRHGNNVLFDPQQKRVIPIDHGCVCPRLVDSDPCNFIWMLNTESTKPFSEENLKRIRDINPKEDRAVIEHLFTGKNFPPERLDCMQLSATLLKMGAEAGLSPFELGFFFYNCLDADHEPLGVIIYKEVCKTMKSNTAGNFDAILEEKIREYLRLYINLGITQNQLLSILSRTEGEVNHILTFCRNTNKRIVPI